MKRNNTAVIVISPFQALCAVEALKEIPGGSYDFFTIEDKQNTTRIQSLLKDFGFDINIIPHSSNVLMWLINAYKMGKFDRFIVGDYFAFPFLLLTAIMARYKANIIFVDDGNTTLLIKANIMPEYMRNFKWKFFLGLLKIKRVKKEFYTIFPIEKIYGMPVTQLSFKHIINEKYNSTRQESVYIIGTNTSALDVDFEQYKITLNQILEYYKDSEKVYYCPHRRDLNNYNDYCNKIGIKLYDTQVSVEYDFVKNKIYPHIIIGFGSTALYTLKKLYPLSEVYNINIELKKKYDRDSYKFISEFLETEGITSCLMSEWGKNN